MTWKKAVMSTIIDFGKFLGIIVLTIIALVIMVRCGILSEDEPYPHVQDAHKKVERVVSKLEAFVMAKAFVEDRLKCPSTAKFHGGYYNEETTILSDGSFRIQSYVDAQNGFGAMIRTYFVCVVKYVGNSNWILVSLEI